MKIEKLTLEQQKEQAKLLRLELESKRLPENHIRAGLRARYSEEQITRMLDGDDLLPFRARLMIKSMISEHDKWMADTYLVVTYMARSGKLRAPTWQDAWKDEPREEWWFNESAVALMAASIRSGELKIPCVRDARTADSDNERDEHDEHDDEDE